MHAVYIIGIIICEYTTGIIILNLTPVLVIVIHQTQ